MNIIANSLTDKDFTYPSKKKQPAWSLLSLLKEKILKIPSNNKLVIPKELTTPQTKKEKETPRFNFLNEQIYFSITCIGNNENIRWQLIDLNEHWIWFASAKPLREWAIFEISFNIWSTTRIEDAFIRIVRTAPDLTNAWSNRYFNHYYWALIENLPVLQGPEIFTPDQRRIASKEFKQTSHTNRRQTD